jgi:hypothetical protein
MPRKEFNMKPARCSIVMLLVFLICMMHRPPSGKAQNQKVAPKDTNTLEQVPDPKVEEIHRIQRTEWPNPSIIVNAVSFYLILQVDGRRVDEELKLTELEKRLMELPIDRWPLGRVVAVQENGLRSPGDNEKISDKTKELKHMLELDKVMIELWPSG